MMFIVSGIIKVWTRAPRNIAHSWARREGSDSFAGGGGDPLTRTGVSPGNGYD